MKHKLEFKVIVVLFNIHESGHLKHTSIQCFHDERNKEGKEGFDVSQRENSLEKQ